jgi:hypothetical protein
MPECTKAPIKEFYDLSLGRSFNTKCGGFLSDVGFMASAFGCFMAGPVA